MAVTEESAVIPHVSEAGDMTDEQARAVAGAALGELLSVGLWGLVRNIDDDDDDDDESGPPQPSMAKDLAPLYDAAEQVFRAAADAGMLNWTGTTHPRNGLVWTVHVHARQEGDNERTLPLNMSKRRPACTVVSAGAAGIGARHSLVSWERAPGSKAARNRARLSGVRTAALCKHCGVVRAEIAGGAGQHARQRVWIAPSDWQRWMDRLMSDGPMDGGPPEKVKKNQDNKPALDDD